MDFMDGRSIQDAPRHTCTIGDSGGPRFTTIDMKLANALNAMIASSGDSGREVGMEIKVMTLDH